MKRFLVPAGILLAAGGVAYLATLGCCQLVRRVYPPGGWVERLDLTPDQRQAVAEEKRQFMAQKSESCQVLCAKRAQMIEILKQPDPDRATLAQLAEEIGQEQTLLEKGTLDYLLAVGRHLEPGQRKRLMTSVTDELRTACSETACGATPGCSMRRNKGP